MHASPAGRGRECEKIECWQKNRLHDSELDGVFLIEKILEKKQDKYHIKWQGYSTTTWEPRKNIPKFIRDYFERTGKSNLPNPRILDTRTCGEISF